MVRLDLKNIFSLEAAGMKPMSQIQGKSPREKQNKDRKVLRVLNPNIPPNQNEMKVVPKASPKIKKASKLTETKMIIQKLDRLKDEIWPNRPIPEETDGFAQFERQILAQVGAPAKHKSTMEDIMIRNTNEAKMNTEHHGKFDLPLDQCAF